MTELPPPPAEEPPPLPALPERIKPLIERLRAELPVRIDQGKALIAAARARDWRADAVAAWAFAKAAWRWLAPGMPPPVPVEPQPGDGPLANLAAGYPLPTWRPLARAVAVMVGLFIFWTLIANLDEVAIANGEVVPEGKVKTIQHLEGGIVREVYVQEGSEVKEGTPLVQLDLALTATNKEELQARLDGLTLQRARLLAEVNGAELEFPAEQASRQPALVEAERRSFEARRASLRATLSVMDEQAHQKELEVQELQTKQRAIANNLGVIRERFAMSTDLAKSGLTSKMDHAALKGQVEDLEGQLDTVKASIPRAQSGIAEAREKRVEEQARFIRTSQGELATAELDLARTRELMSQAADQQRRTQVTSPIDGIVKNLKANTIGGVVRAGEPIMEIVPLHERLLIEARLSPNDRGYVKVDQPATVKLSAFDYTTYGGLEGKVVLVAPDTTIGSGIGGAPQTGPEAQQPFYRVLIETDRSWLGDEDARHTITSGMQATVEIHTGSRTVMHYLTKPVLKLRHEAFRER